MANNIGSLYNSRNVVVGQAAGFFAPPNTLLPADSITVFDSAVWGATIIGVGAATAGTYLVTLTGGPLAAPVTTAAITWNAVASAVASAIQAVLPPGYVAVVTGTAPTWTIDITGVAADQIVVSAAVGTALTGGALVVTPPAWSACGATEQGWAVNYTPTVQDINIEEQPTPVGQQVTTSKLEFVANLAEDTVASLQLALSAAATIQAPDATHFGKTTLTLQPTLPQLAVALETQNAKGLPRRYYIPVATCATNVGQTFRRAAASRMVPVTFTSVCDLSAIQIVEITANHS